MSAAQASLPFDQRWADRREHRRTPGERINPAEYGVDILGRKEAKAFIIQHHYSGSYPAAHLAVGLYRKVGVQSSRLVGAAVFSEGVRSHEAMPRWTGFERQHGTELGRLVLLPEVLHNGESWFITRAFDALRTARPYIRVVLSYCDPLERRTSQGQLVKPGHFGSIYQATNAIFVGRAAARTLRMLPDGRVLHPYVLYKAKHLKKGWAAAVHAIEAAGGPEREGESVAAWIDRVAATLRPVRHPGNFTYTFGLDAGAWSQLHAMHGSGFPYPKAGMARYAA